MRPPPPPVEVRGGGYHDGRQRATGSWRAPERATGGLGGPQRPSYLENPPRTLWSGCSAHKHKFVDADRLKRRVRLLLDYNVGGELVITLAVEHRITCQVFQALRARAPCPWCSPRCTRVGECKLLLACDVRTLGSRRALVAAVLFS